MLSFCKNDFIDLLKNFMPLTTHIFFGLRLDSFESFWKVLTFRGITNNNLSIKHNKKQSLY